MLRLLHYVIFSHDLLYQLCNLILNRNDLSERPDSNHKASAAEATLNTLTQTEKGQFLPSFVYHFLLSQWHCYI